MIAILQQKSPGTAVPGLSVVRCEQQTTEATALMAKVPSLNYDRVVAALGRFGFSFVRQRGSHIRLRKTLPDRVLNITVPAHRPVKRSTLSHILKQAEVTLDEFLNAL
jgi:predicted RNA binding protein YcfA (HicA-like mRNA interferase family)